MLSGCEFSGERGGIFRQGLAMVHHLLTVGCVLLVTFRKLVELRLVSILFLEEEVAFLL
jgi:hypothetical protein